MAGQQRKSRVLLLLCALFAAFLAPNSAAGTVPASKLSKWLSKQAIPDLRERLGRPIASLAVAATVAATVVLGGQQLSQLSGQGYEEQPRLSQGHSPVGFINTPGAAAVPASYGMQAPVLQPATGCLYAAEPPGAPAQLSIAPPLRWSSSPMTRSTCSASVCSASLTTTS